MLSVTLKTEPVLPKILVPVIVVGQELLVKIHRASVLFLLVLQCAVEMVLVFWLTLVFVRLDGLVLIVPFQYVMEFMEITQQFVMEEVFVQHQMSAIVTQPFLEVLFVNWISVMDISIPVL